VLEGLIPLQRVYLHLGEDESALHVSDALMLLLINDIFEDVLFQSVKGQHGDVEGCRMVSLVREAMRVREGRTFQVKGTHCCLVHLLNKDTDRVFMSGY